MMKNKLFALSWTLSGVQHTAVSWVAKTVNCEPKLGLVINKLEAIFLPDHCFSIFLSMLFATFNLLIHLFPIRIEMKNVKIQLN